MENIIKIFSPEHDWFLEMKPVDPILKEPINVGDEVVVCASCKSVMRLDSWRLDNRCHNPNCSGTLTELPHLQNPKIHYFEANRLVVWDKNGVLIRWSVESAILKRLKIEIRTLRNNRVRKILLNALLGEQSIGILEDTELKLVADNLLKEEKSIFISLYRKEPTVEFVTDMHILTEDKPFANLSWKVEYASDYSINHGIRVEGTTGSHKVYPKHDTQYILTANNISKKSAIKDISIKIDRTPIKIESFVADKQEILVGDRITLNWNVPKKQKLTLMPLQSEVTNLTTLEVSPVKDVIYNLVAEGHFSKVDQSLLVKVYPAVEIINFNSSTPVIKFGEKARLSWQVRHYNKIFISNGKDLIDVTNTNQYEFSPKDSQQYFLVIESIKNIREYKSQKVEVQVFHPIEIYSFDADKIKSIPNLPIKLSWKVVNATSVFILPIDGQSKDVTKKNTLIDNPIESTTYKLIAKNKLFTEERRLHVSLLKYPTMHAKDNSSLVNDILNKTFELQVESNKIPLQFSSLRVLFQNEIKPNSFEMLQQFFFDYTNFLKKWEGYSNIYIVFVKDKVYNLLNTIKQKIRISN